MKSSVSKTEILSAMRGMYEKGILPNRRNWSKKRPRNLPSDRIIAVIFGGIDWAEIVAQAVNVEIKCRSSWALNTIAARRNLVLLVIGRITAEIKARVTVEDWDAYRPEYIPKARVVTGLFNESWDQFSERIWEEFVFADDHLPDKREVWPDSLRVGKETEKLIWHTQRYCRVRVVAQLVI